MYYRGLLSLLAATVWFLVLVLMFGLAGIFDGDSNERVVHTIFYSSLVIAWLVATVFPEGES